MAENAYEVLKSHHPKLVVEVLDKSEEISTFLMLVYSHVLYASASRPEDPQDVRLQCQIDEMSEGSLLRVVMRYETENRASPLRIGTRHPVKRNPSLAELLQVNRNVRDLAVNLVSQLERWIDAKPYRKELGLKSIVLENAVFWKNLVFTAEILLRVQWEDLVKAKMRWKDEEDLAHDHPMIDGGYLI